MNFQTACRLRDTPVSHGAGGAGLLRIIVVLSWTKYDYLKGSEDAPVPQNRYPSGGFETWVFQSDISSVLENLIDNFALVGEFDKEMAIGWTDKGQLLEVIYIILDKDSIMIIHAMKCRKQYLRGI